MIQPKSKSVPIAEHLRLANLAPEILPKAIDWINPRESLAGFEIKTAPPNPLSRIRSESVPVRASQQGSPTRSSTMILPLISDRNPRQTLEITMKTPAHRLDVKNVAADQVNKAMSTPMI
jgi:hypothetical protein